MRFAKSFSNDEMIQLLQRLCIHIHTHTWHSFRHRQKRMYVDVDGRIKSTHLFHGDFLLLTAAVNSDSARKFMKNTYINPFNGILYLMHSLKSTHTSFRILLAFCLQTLLLRRKFSIMQLIHFSMISSLLCLHEHAFHCSNGCVLLVAVVLMIMTETMVATKHY